MLDVGLSHYLLLAAFVFTTGAVGFVWRRNAIIALVSIELMLNASNIALVAFNRYNPVDHAGQAFALFVVAIAAAEAAVGLAIVVAVYRLRRSVRTDDVDALKG
ncbi:MAG: NADH-quinone oxidoreductase subunit NuoK [Myxococcota bacterium]|nr:NADH-quinone oxidoreductase subunit NuoK [Myxococcota bacterium]